jgi:deoxyxylulose-5-phosphate synthase
VVDARFVKPLDEALLARLGETCEYLFTIEDNSVAGGFGSAVNECSSALGCRARASLWPSRPFCRTWLARGIV